MNGIGGAVGAQAGFNYQINRFVMGVEADYLAILGAKISGSGNYVDSYETIDASMTADHAVSFRARAGVDLSGVLLYGTAGVGLVRIRNRANANLEGFQEDETTSLGIKGGGFSANKWQPAFVIGGGAETMLTQNLSLRAQVLNYMVVQSKGAARSAYYDYYGDNPNGRYTDQSLLVGTIGLSFRF
jgi:opacity protein-like surface antigen